MSSTNQKTYRKNVHANVNQAFESRQKYHTKIEKGRSEESVNIAKHGGGGRRISLNPRKNCNSLKHST